MEHFQKDKRDDGYFPLFRESGKISLKNAQKST